MTVLLVLLKENQLMGLVLVHQKLYFMEKSVLLVLIIVRLVNVIDVPQILVNLHVQSANLGTIVKDLCASNATKHVLNAKEKTSALLVLLKENQLMGLVLVL